MSLGSFTRTFLMVLFLFLNGCKDNTVELQKQLEAYKVGESRLILDDSTSLDFMRVSYTEEDGKEYLLNQNEFKKQIQVFDLETGFEAFAIPYPTEKPRGIQVVQGITAVNLDSIFIYMPLFIRGSILINRSGEILARYMPEQEGELEKSLINHISFGAMPTIFHKGTLRFIQLPIFDLTNPSNITDEFRFELIYDMKSNEIIPAESSGFPDFYQNKIWPGQDISVSRTMDKSGRTLYSWRYLDHLFIEKDGKVEKKVAKSDFKNTENSPFNVVPTREQQMKKLIESCTYYGI